MLQAENNPEVGPATVLVSHIQASHIASLMNTLDAAPGLFASCTASTFYWVDYFTLRQCQPGAFVPEEILSVMKTMEACLVEIDRDAAYLGRAFCIFEIFAAVVANVPLQCVPKSVTEEVRDQHRWNAVLLLAHKVKKLDCAKAESRSEEDTDKIKQDIARHVGFEQLNAAVSTAILLSMERTRPGAPGAQPLDDTRSFAGHAVCMRARVPVHPCVRVSVCPCARELLGDACAKVRPNDTLCRSCVFTCRPSVRLWSWCSRFPRRRRACAVARCAHH